MYQYISVQKTLLKKKVIIIIFNKRMLGPVCFRNTFSSILKKKENKSSYLLSGLRNNKRQMELGFPFSTYDEKGERRKDDERNHLNIHDFC